MALPNPSGRITWIDYEYPSSSPRVPRPGVRKTGIVFEVAYDQQKHAWVGLALVDDGTFATVVMSDVVVVEGDA